MLFAAVLSVLADVVCLSKQVSVTIVITRQNQSTPVKVEVRGVEPLSEPIRKVTYPQKRMPPGGFEPPTLALQKPCTTTVL